MPLFQNSVITKYLNAQNKNTILEQWNVYKNHFLNPTTQENIRNSNEEQYQGEFLIDLFVNVLEYTKNPTPNFNLTTELKNEKDSKKADGGIIVNDKVFAQVKIIKIDPLPIKRLSLQEQNSFIEKTDLMLTLKEDLQEQSHKFQRTLQRKFEIEILPKKLQDWYLLSYTDFIKELAKLKIKLTLCQEAEWEDYFTQEATKVLALKNEIDATDKAIDKMVYELYGLSEEEIEIVEKG